MNTSNTPELRASSLQEIGQKLKRARESKGLSLREISNLTRISLAFLEKVELGEDRGLPGKAFVIGFIRNYCQAVDLPMAEINEEMKRLKEPDPHQAEASSSQVVVAQSQPESVVFWQNPLFLLGAGLAVVLLLGVLFYFLLRSPEPSAQETIEETTEKSLSQEKTVSPVGEKSLENTAEQAKLLVLPPDTLRLTIRGLTPSWIRLSLDEAPPKEVFLEAAETTSWDARENFKLTLGRTSGVALYLNGKAVVLPQQKGELAQGLFLDKSFLEGEE